MTVAEDFSLWVPAVVADGQVLGRWTNLFGSAVPILGVEANLTQGYESAGDENNYWAITVESDIGGGVVKLPLIDPDHPTTYSAHFGLDGAALPIVGIVALPPGTYDSNSARDGLVTSVTQQFRLTSDVVASGIRLPMILGVATATFDDGSPTGESIPNPLINYQFSLTEVDTGTVLATGTVFTDPWSGVENSGIFIVTVPDQAQIFLLNDVSLKQGVTYQMSFVMNGNPTDFAVLDGSITGLHAPPNFGAMALITGTILPDGTFHAEGSLISPSLLSSNPDAHGLSVGGSPTTPGSLWSYYGLNLLGSPGLAILEGDLVATIRKTGSPPSWPNGGLNYRVVFGTATDTGAGGVGARGNLLGQHVDGRVAFERTQ